MSQFLRDLNADIAAGHVRAIPGDEYDRLVLSRSRERRRQFEREALRLAEVHRFDADTLRNQMLVCMYAPLGSKAFEDYPAFKRALEIARERSTLVAAE